MMYLFPFEKLEVWCLSRKLAVKFTLKPEIFHL